MGLTTEDKKALNGGFQAPELSGLPVRVSRRKAAELITQYFFETSPRSLERWPVRWIRINGRAHCATTDIFAVAESKLAEAAPVMGGRGRRTDR
jgi:hypothetical protein